MENITIRKASEEELKKWSKEQNIRELRPEVYADNASAMRAYEKLGFVKHMLEMRFNPDQTGQGIES